MRMVRRADGNGVELVLQLVEQFAKVGELLRIGEAFVLHFVIIELSFFESILIAITDGHDGAVGSRVRRITSPFASDANAGKVNLLVRRLALGKGDAASDPITDAGRR